MSATRGILLVGNYPPPYGGVPSHLSGLGRDLVANGWTVHVLSPKYKDPSTLGTEGTAVGITLHALLPRGLFTKVKEVAGFWRQLLRHWRYAISRPRHFYHLIHLANRIYDLVISEEIALISAYHLRPCGLAASWVSHRTGIPSVLTIFGEVWSDPSTFEARRFETKVAFEGSAVALAPSAHCANGARRHGYAVDVMYYGVDLARFDPRRVIVPNELAAEFNRYPHRPVVAYVGRMEEEMGLKLLIDAIPSLLAIHEHLRIALVGQSGSLTALAHDASCRYPDRVDVFEDVANDVVTGIYALSDVIVVPSVNERACLGLAVAEASASGKPVVVSDVGGGSEVLGHGAGLLVAPNDVEALTKAVAHYIVDPLAARRAGATGRAFVAEHFDERTRNGDIIRLFAATQDRLTCDQRDGLKQRPGFRS